ncbi:MAG: class I fructose-bisphosphate aldolase [Anaerolineae bacterium]
MNSRLRSIFRSDGRAVIVPIDHTMALGLASGWEKPERTLSAIIEGGADAIMTTYGIAKHFRPLWQEKIAMIVRLDGGTTLFSEEWGANTRWMQLYTVEDALRIGASGVIVMTWFGIPVEVDSIQTTARVAAECERWGVPLAAEALPPRPKWFDAEALATAARIAAEYGADFIKTHYPGSADAFRRIASVCPVPVLTAGGARTKSVRDTLQAAEDMLRGGGAGVFCGRNVWQHPDPAAVTRALVCLIHEGATVEQALQEVPQI